VEVVEQGFTAQSVAGGPVPQAVVADEPHHHGSDGQDADQRKPRRVQRDGHRPDTGVEEREGRRGGGGSGRTFQRWDQAPRPIGSHSSDQHSQAPGEPDHRQMLVCVR
jgi:hypothetical protein